MKPVGRIFALHRGGVDKKDVAELGRDLRARPAHVHGAEKHPAERWLGVVEDVDVVAGKRRHRDAERAAATVAVPKRKRWVVDLFVERARVTSRQSGDPSGARGPSKSSMTTGRLPGPPSQTRGCRLRNDGVVLRSSVYPGT